jgi:excisionase family DNA binding protein
VAVDLESEPVTVSDGDVEDIKQFARAMEPIFGDSGTRSVRLVGPNGEELDIPAPLFEVLRQAIPLMAAGNAVALVPSCRELTTQQAADFLNVSRPYLITLLENGTIPFTKTGTHRRIRFTDVLAYKRRRDAGRREKLARLTQLSQELGLYDRR